MSLSPFFIQQQEARLETYEKLSLVWQERGYAVLRRMWTPRITSGFRKGGLGSAGGPEDHLAGERAMVCLGVAKFRTHQDCADAGTQRES